MDIDTILLKMLTRSLEGRDGQAYPISNWDKKASDLDGDRLSLTEKDAKPLVEAGLLRFNKDGTQYYEVTPAGIARVLPTLSFEPLSIPKLLEWMSERALFNPSDVINEETAIPMHVALGSSRLVLVLGENAGGKSLFRRITNTATHRGKKPDFGDREIPKGPFPVREFIHLSMQGRSSSGMERSFIYGEESYHSTGENSARTIETAIRTVSGRAHPTILYWDEPDIGMSNRAAAGAGIVIRDFVANIPTNAPLVQAVFVTSHNPALVRQLADLDPHYVHLGDADGPKNLPEWFVRQQDPVPLPPKNLSDLALKRFRQIQAVLNAKDESKKPKKKGRA